ncbi:MAG: ABC transporter permease [Vicinamibacterales bacterium]
MRSALARRLARWLPEAIRRDAFEPALADLEYSWAVERRLAGGAVGPRLGRLRHHAAMVGLWLECLRLAVVNPPPRLPHRQPSAARRDLPAMFMLDLRHALRLLRREPGFAAAAVLTLALGVGANTALFAVVEAVLLRPLPYPDAEALVLVKHRDARTGLTKPDIAIGDFVDLRARQQVFSAMAGYYGFQAALAGEREAVRVEGVSLTANAFDLLGLRPAMGRPFSAEDEREEAPPVVIVSHALWQTELGSDPAILTRSIQIGTTRCQVVGVAPPGFHFPPGSPTDVIVPARVPAAAPSERRSGWIYGLGRLAPGVTPARAETEIAALAAALEREHPQQNLGSQYFTQSLRDGLVGDTRRALVLLLAAVGFVLLIACANVGNLLLARSLARQPELATRLAVGAGRGRLVAQTLTEGLVLAVAGGAVGVLVAWRVAPALAAMLPPGTDVPGLDAVGLNPWVLGFSLAATFASALVFSGVACIGVLGPHGPGALGGQRRTTMSGAARRAAATLAAAEIALAVVLLIGAGLTLRSFAKLVAVDPGFSAGNVLTVQFGLPAGRYREAPARSAAYARVFDALRALPGVEVVGGAAVTPLTGNNWTAPLVRPEQPLAAGQRPPEVGWQLASAGYFEALRIPLKAGRLFDARDTPDSPPVVIVSDALAAQFFAGEDPVGRRLVLGDATAEIVGRVGDIRRAALTDTPRADLYFPFERQSGNGITLFIRTAGDPLAALPAIRTALRQTEPQGLIAEVRSMPDIAAGSAAVSRLAMRLLGGFALIALALAAVGIYGVLSYGVERRTRELGTRLALGASRGEVMGLVLREAAVIAGAGLAVGLAAGLAVARTLSSILYEVAPWDPLAVTAAVAVLAATALAAGFLPAHRASRVDPATALAAD